MHACTKDLTKQGRQFLHFEHWESQCLGMQESAALFYKACFACMHVANLGQTWPVPSRPGQSRPVPAPVLSRPSPVPSARLSRPMTKNPFPDKKGFSPPVSRPVLVPLVAGISSAGGWK